MGEPDMKEEIHKHLSTSEIYDKLREAHSLVKDVIYMKGNEKLPADKDDAIEAVNSVLYLAEHHFTDF